MKFEGEMLANGDSGLIESGGISVFADRFNSNSRYVQDTGALVDAARGILVAAEKPGELVQVTDMAPILGALFDKNGDGFGPKSVRYSEEPLPYDLVFAKTRPGGMGVFQRGEGVFYVFSPDGEGKPSNLEHVSSDVLPACPGLTEFCLDGRNVADRVVSVLSNLPEDDRGKLHAYVSDLEQRADGKPEPWRIDELMRIFADRREHPRVRAYQPGSYVYQLPEDVDYAVVYYVGGGLSAFTSQADFWTFLGSCGRDLRSSSGRASRYFSTVWYGLSSGAGSCSGSRFRSAPDERSVSVTPPVNARNGRYADSFVLASFPISRAGTTNVW